MIWDCMGELGWLCSNIADKLTTLLPGEGTVYFVGTETEWREFSKTFYGK